MYVTFEGISTLSNLWHSEKVYASIPVMLEGRLMLFNLVQYLNVLLVDYQRYTL